MIRLGGTICGDDNCIVKVYVKHYYCMHNINIIAVYCQILYSRDYSKDSARCIPWPHSYSCWFYFLSFVETSYYRVILVKCNQSPSCVQANHDEFMNEKFEPSKILSFTCIYVRIFLGLVSTLYRHMCPQHAVPGKVDNYWLSQAKFFLLQYMHIIFLGLVNTLYRHTHMPPSIRT